MKKDGRSRRSFNDAVGRADDPPWHLVKCPQCGDKDATQNPATHWCKECGWGKPGVVKLQRVDHTLPYVDPDEPGPAAPLARDPVQPQAQQPKPTGLVCRTVITKRN